MATTGLFSPSEQSYTSVPLSSVASSSSSQPLRTDARQPFSYRDINLSLNVTDSAVGSSKVTIGETEVWAGVRAEVEDWDAEGGRVLVAVECAPTTPLPTPEFLPSLSSLLSSLFSSLSLPPQLSQSLSILPHQKCWVLYIDILILSSLGGNLIDASIIAARSALGSVRLPRVVPVGVEEEGVEVGSGKGLGDGDGVGISALVKGGKGGKEGDFELVDPSAGDGDGVRLEGWKELPVGITMNLINQLPFLDATLLEQSSSSASLTFCYNHSGNLVGVKQLGEGEVELGRIGGLMIEAKKCAKELIGVLNEKLIDV